MLSTDAPTDLFPPGGGFDVMEGPKMVARAVIADRPLHLDS